MKPDQMMPKRPDSVASQEQQLRSKLKDLYDKAGLANSTQLAGEGVDDLKLRVGQTRSEISRLDHQISPDDIIPKDQEERGRELIKHTQHLLADHVRIMEELIKELEK